MSAAAREAQWISRRTVCAGQATLVQNSSRLLPCSVSGSPQRRALRRRHDLALGAGALGLVEHAGHERDHVAGAAHEHGVADLDPARPDHLLVGERRARDRRAADEHRLQRRDRRDLAGLADVPQHVGQHRGLLLGRELERERAARRVRARAGGGVRVAVGEPHDGAVEVVVELVAAGLDRRDHLLDRLGVVAVLHLRRLEPEVAQRRLEVARRLVGVEVEREEPQPPLRDGLRVLRPDRPGGAAARVDQRLVRVRGVVGGERRAQHHGLAADLDAPGRRDLQRQVVDQRPHEHGHVVAGRPVPARDRARQPPVLVDERQREPVELRHHDHRLAGEALQERRDLLGLASPSRARASAGCGGPARAARRARRPARAGSGRASAPGARRSAPAARPRARRTPRRRPAARRGSTPRAAR